jgi:hypothetical protein
MFISYRDRLRSGWGLPIESAGRSAMRPRLLVVAVAAAVLFPLPVLLAAADNLPLPPVGPTPPPPQDKALVEFKQARAAYHSVVKRALEDLAAAFPRQREKVRSGEFPIDPPAIKAAATLPKPKGTDSPFVKRDDKGNTVKSPVVVPGGGNRGGKTLPKASDFKGPGGFQVAKRASRPPSNAPKSEWRNG